MYIGIDLGTSNSVIAGINDGKSRVFRPADGGEVLPSVIYIDKRGHRLYGRRAHDQGLIAPENVAAGFKRLMGTSTPIEVKGAELTLSPEECSAEIIRQLLGQVTTETGIDNFTGAVITIPAAFNQMQAEATLRAANMAGLERVDLLQEPIAAALAAMEGAERSGQFLIYDLGGGTFDVALAQAINGNVSIVTHQGINMLGGRDFDRMIVNEIVRPWLAANFDLPENYQRDANYKRIIRIAQLAAEKAKIDLSMKEETSIFASDSEIRLTDQSETDIFLDAPITRTQFEGLIRKPIMQTIDMIRNLLSENNYKNEDIDRIVFIGGPSRIPLIRQMVSHELGIAADLKSDPMTAVAVGAAYYCESRNWSTSNVSSAKPLQATAAPVAEEPGMIFDFASRTPEDKTSIIVRATKPLTLIRKVQISCGEWNSGYQPLSDGLTINVPLAKTGENFFDVKVQDEAGKNLPQHDHRLTITRVVATTSSIPAAQTIAVKVLEKQTAKENSLLPLVNKGVLLPASGKLEFASARELKSGAGGFLSFEVFQVEYPERIDLNLCVGLFRIGSEDLPEGHTILAGDRIIFDWRMSDSGILQATVQLPQENAAAIELKVPRIYAPQAGQISFDAEHGVKFAQTILQLGNEEWGDLTAALGPDGGPEVSLLKTRLVEQEEILAEADSDAETLRRMVEEARFLRQDIARMGKKYQRPMLLRRLGKMTAVFNRIARGQATPEELARFDALTTNLQSLIDDGAPEEMGNAEMHLSEMRDMFFSIAWRDKNYVLTWFNRLVDQPYLYPDLQEFHQLVEKGRKLIASGEEKPLRDLVSEMLDARIALGASDMAGELATIVKTTSAQQAAA